MAEACGCVLKLLALAIFFSVAIGMLGRVLVALPPIVLGDQREHRRA